jgi:hypothetical protein
MEIMEWAPLGALLSICIFLFFGYAFFRGIGIIADLRKGEDREVAGLAWLYVRAKERRSTEVGFYLLFFVLPLVAVFLPGLILVPEEAIALMMDSWYVFFGGILLSISLPVCYSKTGEEEKEGDSAREP